MKTLKSNDSLIELQGSNNNEIILDSPHNNSFENKTISPQQVNEAESLECKTTLLIPPNEQQYFIKDLNTGLIYDIRTCETVILKQDEELTRPVNVESDPWEDWWIQKHKRNMELLNAAELGDVTKVKEVLNGEKYGDLAADIDTRTLNKYTALHLVAQEGHFEVAETLLQLGAKADIVSSSLSTPLHFACKKGYKDIIELLVKYKVDINAKDSIGNTPLHFLSEGGWIDCLEFYLQLNPDTNAKNIYEETPIEVAKNVEVRNFLIKSTKGTEVKNAYRRTVIQNVILHNNRADMVKSLVFKKQQVELESSLINGSIKNGIVPSLKVLHKEKSRREKIIEAVRNISKIKEEELKANMKKTSIKKVSIKDFELLQALGKGSFGDVYAARYKGTGKVYAMKVLSKRVYMAQDLLKYAKAERDVLCTVKSDFIAKLDFAFQTANELVLVIEYCQGYV